MGEPCCANPLIACYGNTYYVDCESGNDANDGTEEVTTTPGTGPWLRQPFMQGFTGSYTHQTGDRFIFKGGTICPNGDFPLQASQGGSDDQADYYGIDPSWFEGAAWNQPVFDMQGQLVGMSSDGNNTDVEIGPGWVTFDNFEFRGHYWIGNWDYANLQNASIGTQYGQGITVENCYFHGWSHAPDDGGITQDSYIVLLNFAGSEAVATDCVIEDSDGDGASGTATDGWDVVTGSAIHDLSGGVSYAWLVGGDAIYNVNNSYSPYYTPFGCDAWATFDSVIHDVGTNVTALEIPYWVPGAYGGGPGSLYSYAWNNVIWNANGIPVVIVDTDCGGCAETLTVSLWNNTLVATGTMPCIFMPSNTGDGWNIGTLDVRNNLCISNGTTLLDIEGFPTADTLIDGGNLLMTHNVATALGEVPGDFLAPTQSIDPAVDAGINLTSLCSQSSSFLDPPCTDPECELSLQSLCSDLVGAARPDGAIGGVGAYQFQ